MKECLTLSNILIALVVGCWIYQGAPLTAIGLGTTFGNAVTLSIPILLVALVVKLNKKDES